MADRTVHHSFLKRPEFSNLKAFIEHCEAFEQVFPVLKKKLITVLQEHLYKYLLTFAQSKNNPEAENLEAVEEYEMATNAIRQDIDGKLEALNQQSTSYSEISTPFSDSILMGKEVYKTMNDIFETMVEIGDLARRWVSADEHYSNSLWLQIQDSIAVREDMKSDLIKLIERERDVQRMAEAKRQLELVLRTQVADMKKQKHKIKKSKETILNQKTKTEEIIIHKKEEINMYRHKVTELTDSSSRTLQRDGVYGHLIQLTNELNKLNVKSNCYEKQLERLDREEVCLAERIYGQEMNAEDANLAIKTWNENLMMRESDIMKCKRGIESKDTQIATAKKVREMKLSPDTLRRIYFMRQEKQQQAEGMLIEACLLVARYIDKDWKQLYYNLPFVPPRSAEAREIDIDIIIAQVDGVTAHTQFIEEAEQCLEKWRLFSSKCSIPQLTATLRKLDKDMLASRIACVYHGV